MADHGLLSQLRHLRPCGALGAPLLTFGAALSLLPSLARALGAAHPDDAVPHAASSRLVIGWLSVATLAAAAPWERVCTVMSEPLGMLLTVSALLVEAHAARRNRLSWHVGSGLLAAAAFFTKYSYGVPLLAAILLSRVWRVRRQGVWPLVAAAAAMCLPVLLWVAAVLSPDLGRATELLGVFTNRDEGLRGFTDAFFYGHALLVAVGWPVGIATTLALVVRAAWGRERERSQAAMLFVGLTLAMLTLHPNKQERYLFPAVPILLVLAEVELARHLDRRRLQFWWPPLVGLLLLSQSPLNRLREAVADAAQLQGARPILAHIADNVRDRQPVLLLGTTGRLPHFALTWEMLERQGSEPVVDLLTFPGEQGWDPRYRRGYPSAWGPDYGPALRQALATGGYRSVVTLALGERSPFRPEWLAKWDAWGQNYVRAMDEEATGYVLQSQRSFPESAAVVRIFLPEVQAAH